MLLVDQKLFVHTVEKNIPIQTGVITLDRWKDKRQKRSLVT